MEIIHTIKELQATVHQAHQQNKKVGMVHTMGALHQGHISLAKQCVAENDLSIATIFLNPTQFNDKKDLENYPRTLEDDCQKLNDAGVNIAFVPSVQEMYPTPDTRQFSYPPTDTVMEGAFRPGHFNGVCQIVSKLFEAGSPDRAYFGEKDFQQIAVIQRMVTDLDMNVEIIPCPVIRQEDGLAMSSRNALLTPHERTIAAHIAQTLFKSREYAASHSLNETKHFVIDTLNKIDGLKVQYYNIVKGDTLQDIDSWDDADHIVGCITVFCGATPIRLIDHITYKKEGAKS